MAASSSRRKWWEWTRLLVLASLAGVGLRVGVAQAYVVDGPSMEPTLADGQRVFGLRIAYGLSVPFVRNTLARWSTPDVGDVVILESPVERLELVKRVVGVPGDVIAIHDGVVVRNGVALGDGDDERVCPRDRFVEVDPSCAIRAEAASDAHWLTSGSRTTLGEWTRPITVPADTVFVLGDHRDHSNDSRYFGPVPLSLIRARVLGVD